MRVSSWVTAMFGVAAVAGVAGVSNADEITVGGTAYKNVLVTKTASFYYVQIPDEGRTLNVPVSGAEASSVKIISDPFYRNPLRETYAKNHAKRAGGDGKDVDPAFRAAKGERIAAGGDDAAGGKKDAKAGGGGAAGGFGVPRTAIETTLAQFGFQFQPGPGNSSAVAKRPDGSLELLGGPDNLTGIIAKASGPAQTADAGVGQLQMFLSQLKPEAAGAFAKAFGEAKEKGSASASAGGVNISINRKVNGDKVDIEARLTTS